MTRRFLAALSLLAMIFLVTFGVFVKARNQSASAPKQLAVLSQTRGDELLTAEVSNNEVKVKLKNNHKETITAFAINFDDTTIKEDFAYSDVHFGIEPGDTFEKNYPMSSSQNSTPPRVLLLAVLLRNGAMDGNAKVAQQIKDERLGEKIQILRTLRILEKEGSIRRDFKAIKEDMAVALNTDKVESQITLRELQPSSESEKKFSDDLKNGLQVGREKMLRRFEVLEQLPTYRREHGLIEFKERANKLFAKL